MTPSFSVRTTAHVDRVLKSLAKHHPELPQNYAEAAPILKIDPYNRSRAHHTRKLEDVKPGEGTTDSRWAKGASAMTLLVRKPDSTTAASGGRIRIVKAQRAAFATLP